MGATQATDITRWLHLIQEEFLEVPGLRLTRPQVRRLWSLDDALCDTLLDALVAARFLERTPRDLYVLAGRTRP